MANPKLDMDKLESEFEFIVDGVETDEESSFNNAVRRVGGAYDHCKKNYGEACNNSSNSSCGDRGQGVTHCDSEGVYHCSKVNNQGCHGAGRFTVKPKSP